MGDYRRLDNGEPTTSDDPARGIWYAASHCGYWTDDWSKLRSRGGIPTCPGCGVGGFQIGAREWWDGVEDYTKDHPQYDVFISQSKEHCVGRMGPGLVDRYKEFLGTTKNGA